MSTARTLNYRNHLEELGRMAQDVGGYCREHGVDPDTALALTLCLNELFTNTVKYAYSLLPPGQREAVRHVEVCLRRLEDRVEIHYSDDGHPFDPVAHVAAAPDLDVPVEELPTGGFGLHLLRQLSSQMSYSREDGRNTVSLSFIWR